MNKKQNIKDIISSRILPSLENFTPDNLIIGRGVHAKAIKNTRELRPMYDMDNHYHNDFEVCYVLKKECLLNLEGAVYCLKEGDFCIVSPKLRHTEMLCKGENSYDTIWFLFNNCRLSGRLGSHKGRSDFSFLDYIDVELPLPVAHIFPLIAASYGDNSKKKFTVARGFLLSIFAMVADLLEKEKSGREVSVHQKVLSEAVRYLKENYTRDVTLTEIAREIGFSPNYFSSLFKKYSSLSLFGYLNKIRVEKAKELLKERRCNIKEISNLVGYSSPYYFSYIFKKLTKIPPEKYRLRIT